MEHAVQQIVAEAAQRAVDMTLLPALAAIGAGQRRAAIEAGALAFVDALARLGLDRAGDHAAGDRLAQSLYRHLASLVPHFGATGGSRRGASPTSSFCYRRSMTRTGLLGGSFNPAHRGHRRISLAAARRLGLDEVWWLVSPGNPLKPEKDMAPLAARLVSARRVARRSG